MRTKLTTFDLEYDLPQELVAQHPTKLRGQSRLLVATAGVAKIDQIGEFDSLFIKQLRPDDLVVANDARVINARIAVLRPTGGKGEIFLLSPIPSESDLQKSTWNALSRPARRFKPGSTLTTLEGASSHIKYLERTGSQTCKVLLPVSIDEVSLWLESHGEVPLPPYISEPVKDPTRYQTVHANTSGAVAAPTAGLHFDEHQWDRVRNLCEVAMLTLHVGAGTFLPMEDGPLALHTMHEERYSIPDATDLAIRSALAQGRRVVAIGTTTTRVLEHVYRDWQINDESSVAALEGSTDIFISPGHEWCCVGALLTNFHLPRSTLLALVMSFLGQEPTRHIYEQAVAERMRFYSFGDAMFIHGHQIESRFFALEKI